MSTVETVTAVEPIDERGSAVRFETQCVVIPDSAQRSRRPRVVTKSYALPLWKRRTPSSGSSASPEDASFEDNHLVLRVPLPTISLKQAHSTTHSVDLSPLPPCLVHRPQPISPSSLSSSLNVNRHARTPRKPSPSPPRPDVVTVPLRPCCAACQPVTEAALVDGDAWPEHFSRAASRQRSLSVDGAPRTLTVAGSAAAASYGSLGVSISVDEIDKRRRASDTGPPPTSKESLWPHNVKPGEEFRVPLILCRNVPSNSPAADPRNPPSPSRVTPATPRIPEEEDDEDESELFPLPSPKRTPATSPAPSLAGSMSSLMVAQPSPSSGASPTPSMCSGDCAVLAPNKRHFLEPPTCSSSSSLSLPKLSGSTPDLSSTEDPPRVPSPTLLSALPPLSTRSPSSRIVSLSATGSTPSKAPRGPEPALALVPAPPPVPIPSSHTPARSPSSPHHSPTQVRLPWRSRRSASGDIAMNATPSVALLLPASASTDSPPPTLSLPTTTSQARKPFSMSSPLQVFADVFRGVGGISGVASGLSM